MPLLQINSLSKTYGEKKALDNVSFSVDEGEIVALIGKNGAGKTTLMNIISSITAETAGEVFYKGTNILENPDLLNEFGILITAVFLDYLNTYQNLKNLMMASEINDPEIIDRKINDVLSLVGLSSQKTKKVKTFSFGMKQRLGFAQALLNHNKFLILDEPFVGMDPLGKEMMKSVILRKAHEDGAGILFSSHELTDVEEICDRIVMISGGKKIYDGKFTKERRYEIEIAGNMVKDILFKAFENIPSVELYSDKVVFDDKKYIHDVVTALVENEIFISDINVAGSSLLDFFNREAT